MSLQRQIAQDVGLLSLDPDRYTDYAFRWGKGELEGEAPRTWQRKVNRIIRDHLQNPKTRFMPLLIAVASGHGIGKSAEMGMLSNWALSTCEDCKIVLTANTKAQLITKTMPEISKWFRRSITRDWFDVQTMSIKSLAKGHQDAWRMDAIPWSVNNTEAFAGLHNKRKRIILLFDEGSAIDDKVWEVAEGALTDEETEIIWVVFGNPTRAIGRFRECFRKFRHRWVHLQIDSREVEGTNKQLIAEWEKDHGVDSDFFKIRVRGIFPSQSAKQFISEADADAALGRHLRDEQYNWAPKILTLDPAWEGDDEMVFGLRQGLAFKILHRMAKNDNDVHVANQLARFEDEHKADAVFIDGGYGTGIYSAGKTMHRSWQLVWFSEKPFDEGCLNKRAEMWKDMRDWLKAGGAIPNDPQLHSELTSVETVPRLDGKLQLMAKKDMKKLGLPSPNRADALALSFAYPVTAKTTYRGGRQQLKSEYQYNPDA
jgi:hypothetical protein